MTTKKQDAHRNNGRVEPEVFLRHISSIERQQEQRMTCKIIQLMNMHLEMNYFPILDNQNFLCVFNKSIRIT